MSLYDGKSRRQNGNPFSLSEALPKRKANKITMADHGERLDAYCVATGNAMVPQPEAGIIVSLSCSPKSDTLFDGYQWMSISYFACTLHEDPPKMVHTFQEMHSFSSSKLYLLFKFYSFPLPLSLQKHFYSSVIGYATKLLVNNPNKLTPEEQVILYQLAVVFCTVLKFSSSQLHLFKEHFTEEFRYTRTLS